MKCSICSTQGTLLGWEEEEDVGGKKRGTLFDGINMLGQQCQLRKRAVHHGKMRLLPACLKLRCLQLQRWQPSPASALEGRGRWEGTVPRCLWTHSDSPWMPGATTEEALPGFEGGGTSREVPACEGTEGLCWRRPCCSSPHPQHPQPAGDAGAILTPAAPQRRFFSCYFWGFSDGKFWWPRFPGRQSFPLLVRRLCSCFTEGSPARNEGAGLPNPSLCPCGWYSRC